MRGVYYCAGGLVVSLAVVTVVVATYSREVRPLGARFRASMPGNPTEHHRTQGDLGATSYDLRHWGCAYSVIYSDSVPGGLAASEVSSAAKEVAKGWGGAVVTERELPRGGWPEVGEEFEAVGPGHLRVKGRLAVFRGRIYIWYVGCSPSVWVFPWTQHYARQFVTAFEALQ